MGQVGRGPDEHSMRSQSLHPADFFFCSHTGPFARKRYNTGTENGTFPFFVFVFLVFVGDLELIFDRQLMAAETTGIFLPFCGDFGV